MKKRKPQNSENLELDLESRNMPRPIELDLDSKTKPIELDLPSKKKQKGNRPKLKNNK